jgi:mono/diheme cytochrome c family protein
MTNLIRVTLVVLSIALVFTTWAPAETGADVYKKCVACHGADGKGQTPMGKTMKLRDLASPEVQKQSDAELTTIIAKGKAKMPPYDGKLTKEQIDEVVKYIRTLK